MYPVFLSVSSNDEKFAHSIWEDLPRDWAYLYSASGEEGAELWDEISRRELPSSNYLIVFWSKDYVRAKGCVRELRQAAELVASGTLSPLILRLDDFPIIWSDELPGELKQVFSDLAPLLEVRTSRPNIPVDDASHLVQRFIEPAMNVAHPMFPRDDILEPMRSAVQKERFKCFPAMWISGFPGAGRTTLVEQLNRSMTPNGRLISIDINAASLPRQICLKLESGGLGADFERLQQVQEAEEAAMPSGVAARIDRIFQAGNYVVFRHEMILQNNVDLPEWFDDVVGALDPAQRPKLFIVSQMPLSIERRKACFDKLAEQRVPGFSNHEVTSFTESLLAHFDPQPDRWSAKAVDDLIEAAQGNLGLLVTLAKAASSVIDLGEVDELVAHAKNRALQSIAYYVDWAFGTLHDHIHCQRLLLFLNDVSPCDPRDLGSLFEDASESILNILSKCIKLGFVERDSGGLYRLTPFLSGRLGRHLVRADLVDWRRTVIENFAKSPIDLDTENGFIRIEARIQASLWTGKDDLPNLIEKFVSASHWFQAGVRLYHARQHAAAHRLLKKVFAARESFSQASRTELLRYFGLAAIRTGHSEDVERCILLLNGDYKSKEIASYLEAFNLEVQQRFLEAKEKYEEALRLNQGMGNRLERIYRPLIKCILLTKFPDFGLAEDYALDWAKVRQTVFAKHALCRIYLLWMHEGPTLRNPTPADLKKRYDDALNDLQAHPGGTGAYHEVLAEDAELREAPDVAVAELEKAIAIDDRVELQLRRWQIMARDKRMSSTALSELEEMKADVRKAGLRDAHLKGLVEIFVTAMFNDIYSAQRLNRFAAPLESREIGAILNRLRRRSADA
ncbi:toll/interleukin-1 receptor domain-containing protein [Rhizobium sp. CB3060]|uniref:toll/interleukin-1 receptor domain-containing protein n=1 Tax=Rhizobium sp. CB3060 TaxID=3138255 RepID=UPI0021A78653|nr:toll/interleukin-1 receptor domain-containing protein [Rhizobium tropici]UWU20937.1 toll/interleukin-1 receptor domain-containing protein [Rhizobium tropici]